MDTLISEIDVDNIDMEQKDGSIVNLGEKYGEKYMNKKGN